MEGVVKEVPLPRIDPPLAAAYQLRVPAEAVAPRLTVPVPQREAGLVAVTVGMLFIVARTEVREVETQPEAATTSA